MSDTPRTNALRETIVRQYKDDECTGICLGGLLSSLSDIEELEKELAAANKRFEALAFDAARVEWKYGRNDDGTPKNWTEWNNLRESLGEHVRQPQELEPNEARH